MARLESIAKGGYYPLPPNITVLISNFLEAPDSGRVLDICAGKGVALTTFSKILGLQPYGSELNTNRAAEAKQNVKNLLESREWQYKTALKDKNITRILPESFENIKTAKKSMQFLYLNPPYDWDSGVRLEYTFLKRGTQYLQEDGILVFVIPQSALRTKDIAEYLNAWYTKRSILRFPDPDYDTFKQFVIIAKKRRKRIAVPAKKRDEIIDLANLGDGVLSLLDVSQPTYEIPKPILRTIPYKGLFLNESDLEQEIELYGNMKTEPYKKLFTKVDMAAKRPLMPFKIGHLSGLMVAGLLNHITLESDKETLLIRGRDKKTRKNSVETHKSGTKYRTVNISREVPDSEMQVLNQDGDIKIIGSAELPIFLNTWLPQLSEAVDRDYNPVYKFPDPTTNIYAQRIGRAGSLFPAQLHATCAIATRLSFADECFIVGEMGVGKTRIGAAIALAVNARRSLFMCPAHLVPKWIREIKEVMQFDKANVIQVDTIAEVDAWMKLDDSKVRQIAVVKLTTAGAASGWIPQVVRFDLFTDDEANLVAEYLYAREENKLDPTIKIPELSQELYNKLPLFKPWLRLMIERGMPDHHMGRDLKNNKGSIVSHTDILKENAKQYWHYHIGQQFNLSKERTRYVPFFQYKRHKHHNIKFSKISEQFELFQKSRKNGYVNPNDIFPQHKPGKGRWRIADHIKKKHSKRIDLFVVDEAHKTKGIDSDQGYAMHRLSSASKKTVLMTGTIYGGKSSTLFYLLYRTCKDIREAFTDITAKGQRRIQVKEWIKKYGMYEYRSTTTEDTGAQSGNKRVTEHHKEAPGSSPTMLPWLLERTVFLSLSDLNQSLPTYEEIPIPVPLVKEQLAGIKYLDSTLGQEMRKRLSYGDKSLMSIYLMANLCWVDSSWRNEVIKDPKTKAVLVVDNKPVILPAITNIPVFPKEKLIIDLIKDNVYDEGRRVLLLCQQTKIRDITPKWMKYLQDAGMNPVTLRSGGNTQKREAWINKQVADGKNVLISHPKSVETGLDLYDFPTVIWIGTEYSVYTIMQACRRPYRVKQTKPIRVYFYYYELSLQEAAIALISQKVAASIRVNGDVIADDSLAAEDAGSIEDSLSRMIQNNDDVRNQNVLVGELFKKAKETADQSSSYIGNYKIHEEPKVIEGEYTIKNGSGQDIEKIITTESGTQVSIKKARIIPTRNGVSAIPTDLEGKVLESDPFDDLPPFTKEEEKFRLDFSKHNKNTLELLKDDKPKKEVEEIPGQLSLF